MSAEKVAFEIWKRLSPEGMGAFYISDEDFENALIESGVNMRIFHAMTDVTVKASAENFRNRKCCTGESCSHTPAQRLGLLL